MKNFVYSLLLVSIFSIPIQYNTVAQKITIANSYSDEPGKETRNSLVQTGSGHDDLLAQNSLQRTGSGTTQRIHMERSVSGQKEFHIKGKIGMLNAPAMVFLSYGPMGRVVRDSAVLKNGSFEFRGRIDAPVKADLSLRYRPVKPGERVRRDAINIYLEDGLIQINSADSLFKATVTGSALNTQYRELRQLQDAASAKEAEARKSGAPIDAAVAEYAAKIRGFIQRYPNSPVALDAIEPYLLPIAGDVHLIAPMFDALSKEMRETSNGRRMAASIEQLKKTAVGSIAPDFQQTDPDNKPVRLSDYRGKYVLIDFWASWCRPCRQENPHLIKSYNQFKDQNFTILGITMDRSYDAWIKAIQEDGLPWKQAGDIKSQQNTVADLYSINAIPQNFLIDPQGKIIARNLRGEQLADKLREVLKEVH